MVEGGSKRRRGGKRMKRKRSFLYEIYSIPSTYPLPMVGEWRHVPDTYVEATYINNHIP